MRTLLLFNSLRNVTVQTPYRLLVTWMKFYSAGCVLHRHELGQRWCRLTFTTLPDHFGDVWPRQDITLTAGLDYTG